MEITDPRPQGNYLSCTLTNICTKVATPNCTFWLVSHLYIKESHLPHDLRLALAVHGELVIYHTVLA